MDDIKKVKLSGIHFEGRASVWYRSYQSSRVNTPWKAFLVDVLNRFENPDNRDFQDLFNRLKQLGSVSDYEDNFEELKAMVCARYRNFPGDYFVSSFLNGLNEHIKGAVKMFKPQTLADTIFLAKLEESRHSKFTLNSAKPYAKTAYSHVSEPTTHNSTKSYTKAAYSPINEPKSSRPTAFHPKTSYKDQSRPRSTLSNKEILERREKGLCFHCDESYHPGRDCKARLYAMIGDEEMINKEEDMSDIIKEMESMLHNKEKPGKISLNAMAGN